jgi:hypothetical protein
MMDRIESIVNFVSDLDWFWWPMLRFRPGREELFSSWRVLVFTALVVVAACAIAVLLQLASNRSLPLEAVVVVSSATLVCVFAWFRIMAYFWNRRALRLQKERA